MKTKIIKSSIIFTILLICVTFDIQNTFSQTQQKSSNIKQSGIIIKGEITNYKNFSPFITKDTYLQLILVTPDGSIQISTDSIARYSFGPGYTKTTILPDGKFKFHTKQLDAGSYSIAVQLLNHRSGQVPFPFLIKDSDFIKIEINDSLKVQPVFEIGKCSIRE